MALAEAQQAFLQASVFPVNINSIGSVRTSNALINDRLTILNEAFLCPKDMLGTIHMELPIVWSSMPSQAILKRPLASRTSLLPT
jgi:hypothetical protein